MMNGNGGDSWDDDELARLGTALGYDPSREPPADRVAAVRAAAERLRASRAVAGYDLPPVPPPAPVPPTGTPGTPGVPARPALRSLPSGSVPPPAPVGASPQDGVVVPFARRRQFLLGALAASVGAAAGFGAKSVFGEDSPSAGPPTEQIAFAGAAVDARTEARLINHTWGTELLLDVSGLADGQTYAVSYTDRNGTVSGAGSFLSVANTQLNCRFNAATLRADLAVISIADAAGTEMLRADLS